MWKPAEYPSLSPYLVTPSVGEGSITHAEIRIDDSVAMINAAGQR